MTETGTPTGGQEKPTFLRRVLTFFDSTTRVIVALGTLVAAITALVAGVRALTGDEQPPAPAASATTASAVDAAKAVADCEARHEMSQQRQRAEHADGTVLFQSCAWPPPQHADADGYLQFLQRVDEGPGEAEYTTTNIADRITGPCQGFTVTYDFGRQGSYDHRPPFVAPAGIVVRVEPAGMPYPKDLQDLKFYPDRGEAAILRNSSYVLRDVTCAS